MTRRQWTPAEDAVVVARYPHEPTQVIADALGRTVSTVYQRAARIGLKKSEAYLASPAACRTTGRQGMGTRFEKGHQAWNKGTSFHAGGRSIETRFKKGERRGVAARLYQPIGTERLSKDGYRERKVNDDLPLQARWRAVHLVLWEAANGPVPQGHVVVFVNGDKTDIRLDNLALVSRRDLMRRNSVHNLPQPLAQTIQLLGALRRQIRKRTHGEEQNQRSA